MKYVHILRCEVVFPKLYSLIKEWQISKFDFKKMIIGHSGSCTYLKGNTSKDSSGNSYLVLEDTGSALVGVKLSYVEFCEYPLVIDCHNLGNSLAV